MKIDCWYFLFQVEGWYFSSNWLIQFVFFTKFSITLFKLFVDISFQIDNSVPIDCSKVYLNWLFIYSFELTVHIFNQNVFWLYFLKMIVGISFQNFCWFFCSNWLLTFLFTLTVCIFIEIIFWHFGSNWLLIYLLKLLFLLKLINPKLVQNDCSCFCSN